MERKILADLVKWKESRNKGALVVKGCRQVGKTYIIDEFLKNNYSSFIKINFEDERDKRSLFSSNLDAKSIIDRLTIENSDFGLNGDCAIFFDEIQACPGAFSALKPLVVDGRCDIIASGSLLGIELDTEDRLSPAGYIHFLDMYPMDFEEFLWAMGVNKTITEDIRKSISDRVELDDYLYKKTNELFLRYMITGGMPAAVDAYRISKDYSAARKKLEDLINIIRSDASRYSPLSGKNRIAACFDSLAIQLSSEKKKFSYSKIEKKRYGSREYAPAVDWLTRSGVALKCNNVTNPKTPLECNADVGAYKIYLSDTGILTAMMDPIVAGTVVNKDPFANNGALAENAVASALAKKGYRLFYFAKRDSTLEIDFLTVIDGQFSAIEVKSGKNKKSKSLTTIMSEKYDLSKGMKISNSNVFTDEKGILHLPLFAPSFFPDAGCIDIAPVDIGSLSG